MERLKRCPFCGGIPIEISPYDQVPPGVRWIIECTDCRATMRGTHRDMNRDDWNRRVSTKPHWIKISPAGIYACPECGHTVMTRDIDSYQFCHGCGIELGGEEDE